MNTIRLYIVTYDENVFVILYIQVHLQSSVYQARKSTSEEAGGGRIGGAGFFFFKVLRKKKC